MASKNYLLPSVDQCSALTDEQCRTIMDLRDPDGIRAQKNWELAHQPELVRQYMTMRSFTQIEQIMRSRLEWSYKTYANRYRDWLFPVDRVERELAIMYLYARVNANEDSDSVGYSMAHIETPQPPQPLYQEPQNSKNGHTKCHEVLLPLSDSRAQSRLSVDSFASTSTWSDGSAWGGEAIFDNSSNPRLSISTLNTTSSSDSHGSHSFQVMPQLLQQVQQPRLQLQANLYRRSQKAPTHDPRTGLWNSVLKVIPCDRDHSRLPWEKPIVTCSICGFSAGHALMINARKLGIRTFAAGVTRMRDMAKPDFAGNYPLAYLMAAGVGIKYFRAISYDAQWSNFDKNIFYQSPLHVLNPQDLGQDLLILLKWFSAYLSLRDSKCRTLLHYLFQYPLEPGLHRKILGIFPNATHHLQSFDTSGKCILQLMEQASFKAKSISTSSQFKIQTGISEVHRFISETNEKNHTRKYGFIDIARGSRGNTSTSYTFLPSLYQCRICHSTGTHSNSYMDQMQCACQHGGIDRNACDDQGWTAAHLLVTITRCNNDAEQTPETPGQTAELFRLLIWGEQLREALYVRDPEGNSLVWNVATRGFDEILLWMIGLEAEAGGWRRILVNGTGKDKGGRERSVLEGVEEKIREVDYRIRAALVMNCVTESEVMADFFNRLKVCRNLLKRWGAVARPVAEKNWKASGG